MLEIDRADISCDALISKTLDGIVIGWNAGAQKLFGYNAEEMIGQPILRLFPADRHQEEDGLLARLRAGERIEQSRTLRMTKDGEYIEVLLTIVPIKDHDGHIVGALKVIRGITDRQRTEESLRARDEAAHPPDAGVPVRSKPVWHGLFGASILAGRHPSVLTIAALTVATLLHLALTPVFGSGYHFITYYPAIIFSTILAGWKYGLAATMISAILSLVVPTNSEQATTVLVFLAVNAVMIVAADATRRAGRHVEEETIALRGREGGLREETAARQTAEKALRDSEAQLWFVANHAPVCIAQYDCEGRYKFVNQPYAAMFGLRPADVVGRPPREVIGEDVYMQAKPYMEAALAGQPREYDIHLPATTGGPRVVHVSYQSERDAAGAVVGFLEAITDITARKQAEQALRRSEERLSRILSSATEAIISVDERQRITLFNRAAEAMFGCAATEAIGRPLNQFLPERFRQAHRAQVEEFGQSGVTVRRMGRLMMVYGLRANGQEFPAEASISQIESSGEKSYTVILRDMTERVRMEADLADVKRRTDAILESAGEAIFGLNKDGFCIFINPAGAAMFGYRVDDLIGKNMHEILHHSYPDGRVYAVRDCPIYTSLIEGRTFRTDDEVFWHRNGTPLPVAYTSTPILEEGRPTGSVVVIRDISERKRVDERLRENEARLQQVLKATNDVVWDWDVVRDSQIWSQTGADLFGWTDIVEMPQNVAWWMDRIHPDDRRRVVDGIHAVVDHLNRFHWEDEYRFLKKDSSYAYVFDRGSVIRDAQGKAVRMIGAMQDITARKEAEARVKESEQHFRQMTESLPQLVWTCSPGGGCDYLSPQWITYTGIPEAPQLGYGWLEQLHPEDRKKVIAAWETVLPRGDDFHFEFRIRRHDGTYRWFQTEAVALRDEQGAIVKWFGTNTDVTEQREAEAALRDREQRLRYHVSNAGLAVIEWDAQWLVTRWEGEAERIFGWTAQERVGRALSDLQIVYDKDITHVQRMMARLNDGVTRALVSHNRNYTKNGRVIHCIWHNSVLLDGEGRLSSVLSLVHDNTEQIEAEESLRSLANRLEQSVAERTQELQLSQNQLRALAAELNLAEQRERKRLAAELHDHLQQMLVLGKLTIGQGKRAVGIHPDCEAVLKRVDDILSDALTYSRTLVAELSPPVLHDHGLEAGLRWLGNYMKKHGQTVTVVVPDRTDQKLPEAHTVLLFQCVRELLINASKHAGTGHASVRMLQHENQVQIEVRDEGKGFDFSAAAAAGIPNGGLSSKFGLFSIQERMRALGGTLDFKSTPGQGTTATLVLPVAQRAETSLPSPESLVPEAAVRTLQPAETPPRIRVLLVDDHVMVRQGLRAVLDAYADVELVGEAGNGEEAVQLVDRLRPTVVVMDINMPKMNGIDATLQIKHRYPETIVIGLSVNAAGENQEAMKRAGAVCLMTKEAAVEELYDAILEAKMGATG